METELTIRIRQVADAATVACHDGRCQRCDPLIGQLVALARLACDDIARLAGLLDTELRRPTT